MTIESLVAARLAADAGVAAIVGAKVHGLWTPEDTAPPYLVIAFDTARSATLKAAAGPLRSAVTVRVYATTYETMIELARAARAALDGWRDLTQTPAVLSTGWASWRDDREPETGFPFRELTFAMQHGDD